MATDYKSVTLKSLVVLGAISTFSELRENVNDYPFITALDKKGNANNLYLSKGTAKTILSRHAVGDSILHELVKSEIVQTENASGEIRFKIVLPVETKYASKSEMISLFGLEEEIPVEFDMESFVSGFERV